MPLKAMDTKFKKLIIAFLIIPSGLFWFGLSLLGTLMFSNLMFRDVQGFLIFLLPTVGMYSLVCVFFAVIHYPKVSRFDVISVTLGFLAKLIGIYLGLFGDVWLLASGCCLLLGSTFLIWEYVSGT
ncbi:hypothetical protein [Aliiglaciecola sp. M165]|uniref:hypothetical protein n=1 Tax=Aliiglaciecola sp. M165 TaxID=2593649 RepID=UPI00117E1DF5|nr:hypothetical protein [Aliiglaciecola sp. M165]TRY28678.1 hypothetical protein FM019_20675 [Aliiglaciecola sp. M165]